MGKLTVEGGVQQGNIGVFELVEKVVRQLPYDYVVISWLRPGATIAGSGNPSMHGEGNALDIRPAGYRLLGQSPCGRNMLDAASMKKLDVLNKALQGIGNNGDGPLWRTCTGGNHYDHVHIGHEGKAGAVGAISVGSAKMGEKAAGGMEEIGAALGIGGLGIAVAIAIGLGLFVIGFHDDF